MVHQIESYCKVHDLKPEGMNILDWGCGRGREVLWLRERGYNARGVDIDALIIENGMDLFKKKGHGESTLRLIQADGKTDFPDGIFHLIYSNQVFEHIQDLESVAAEMYRITAKKGWGFHIYPARLYWIEPHFRMPLVHWLPKNKLREWAIRSYVRIGREPHWKELEGRSARDKAAVYIDYSMTKTAYRSYRSVKRTLVDAGFKVQSDNTNNRKLRNHPLIGPLLRVRMLKRLATAFLVTFWFPEVLVKKCSSVD